MLHRPFNTKVSPRDGGPAHALSNTRARCNGVRPLQSFAGDQGLPATRRDRIVDFLSAGLCPRTLIKVISAPALVPPRLRHAAARCSIVVRTS